MIETISIILKVLKNGLGTITNFFVELPSLFTKLIVCIPEPLRTVTTAFLGIIIFIILLNFARKVIGAALFALIG